MKRKVPRLSLKKYGAMLIWIQQENKAYAIPRDLAKKFPTAQLGDKFTLSWRKHRGKTITFGWTYLQPNSFCQLKLENY